MTDASFKIEMDDLVLDADPGAGVIRVSRSDGRIVFGPLLCRASFRDRKDKTFDPMSSLVDGWQFEETDVKTPLGDGKGFSAKLGAPGLPTTLVWECALVGGERALFRLTLVNNDEGPLKLYDLSPLGYRGADPGLDMGAGYSVWRFFRTGYQSWSPAGSIGIMERDYKPRFFLPSRTGMNARTPYSDRPGEKVSDWMAQVVEPQMDIAALMGFVTSASMSGRVELEVKYDRFRRLEAVCDGEGMMVPPGETVESEWLLLSLSDDPHGQHASYFDDWGKAMNARVGESKTGWCTWYFAFWSVKETDVDANLFRLNEHRDVLELVQLDDGFQAGIGEWTEWNDKFPTPPAGLAARIKEQGFRPGLWMAPFFAARGSKIAKHHPDWILKKKNGGKVTAFLHPAWKGHVIYALDLTHPEVIEWLKKTIKTVVSDFGFSYLKLDFLYAAALPGMRHDPTVTGAQALRRGLEAIREAAGDDTYILGCGCPLGPAIGVVDCMRVSQDVDIRWKIPLLDTVQGVPTGPGASNSFKNNLNRAYMHGRLWANDPDCVVLRDARGGMNEEEMKSELTLYYLSGGANFLSENVGSVPKKRMDWFIKSLPPAEGHAVPLDLFKKDFPETFVKRGDDSVLLALFNWDDSPAKVVIDLGKLGLSGSWHAFDYWGARHLGVVTDRMELGKAPAHGCRYIRMVPADGQAKLLATDLHMGMGELGFDVSAEGETVKVKATLPGKRSGRVWAVKPGGRVEMAEVKMDGSWEGEL